MVIHSGDPRSTVKSFSKQLKWLILLDCSSEAPTPSIRTKYFYNTLFLLGISKLRNPFFLGFSANDPQSGPQRGQNDNFNSIISQKKSPQNLLFPSGVIA
jgi:hypothetical protein